MLREPPELHYYYDYCNLGGVTSILKQRVTIMRRQGYRVPIVMNFLRDLGGRAELELLPSVEVRLCPVESFRVWSAERIAINTSAQHILIDQPEVVHILGSSAEGLTYEVHTSLEQAFRRMRSVNFGAVKRIICPSNWLRQKLREVLIGYDYENIRICPNFVDSNLFKPLTVPAASTKVTPIALWVGKLNADKNLADALEIIRHLGERVRPVFVTGGGSDRKSVAAFLSRLETLRLNERAKWIVNLPNAELPRLLADVRRSGGFLLSTSKFESFGLAILEAMSCGVPVVGAAVGGIPEIIVQGKNGFLYPLCSPTEAVRLCNALLDSEKLYAALSEAAAGATTAFDPDAAVQRYVSELLS